MCAGKQKNARREQKVSTSECEISPMWPKRFSISPICLDQQAARGKDLGEMMVGKMDSP